MGRPCHKSCREHVYLSNVHFCEWVPEPTSSRCLDAISLFLISSNLVENEPGNLTFAVKKGALFLSPVGWLCAVDGHAGRRRENKGCIYVAASRDTDCERLGGVGV